MMLMHVASGLSFIALALGTFVVVWSMKNPGKGSALGKFFGGLVMVFSIISVICIYSCVLKGAECHKGLEGSGMTAPATTDASAPDQGTKKVERKR